ncbi:hypothetical protein [Wolbachia endosymbiont of Litomosoides brasiliensis]|uniref:hypothetical protein n=1 Tax=Wolbachia endosymbiont of Litomosoides brasiliensis TaxID=1812117 RepID=UPI00397CFB02
MCKKIKCCDCSKKYSVTTLAKIYCILRTALTAWIKHPKFGREEKLFTLPQRRRKTRLNWGQFKQVEVWMQENPNITIKEMRIRIQEKLSLNVSKSIVHRSMQSWHTFES